MKLAFGELIVHCPCKANLVQHPAFDVVVMQTADSWPGCTFVDLQMQYLGIIRA